MMLGVILFMCQTYMYVSCSNKMNVLFLAADDMRPELGVYNKDAAPTPVHPKMHTPVLDGLAAKSLLLKKAYVQQAVCAPSRASILTSRRPDTTHVYDLVHYWRDVGGNYTTIPQYFKRHGYRSVGMGKIFHPGRASHNDDPLSWSEKYFHGKNNYIHTPTWMSIDPDEEKSRPLIDQLTADHAIESLQRLAPSAKNGSQPFFLAVGFHRPHLPFISPKRFFDLYPVESVKLPANPYIPANFSDIAWSNFDELRTYKDILNKYGRGGMNTTLPDDVTLALRRAYYAAISYVDSLIGNVLQELDTLGLSNNTIVSFWGDHGWQLGEHNEWCKHTDFNLATRAPMMIHIPGTTDHGVTTNQLTEFVDLFPTLVDAAGLPSLAQCPPGQISTKVETCTEGSSLMPLIHQDSNVKWKTAVFSQYPRMAADGNIYMGYSMTTDKYRYTEWTCFDYTTFGPVAGNWDLFHTRSQNGVELYDHQNDPQENHNQAFSPEYAEIRKILSKRLRKGYIHELPTRRDRMIDNWNNVEHMTMPKVDISL